MHQCSSIKPHSPCTYVDYITFNYKMKKTTKNDIVHVYTKEYLDITNWNSAKELKIIKSIRLKSNIIKYILLFVYLRINSQTHVKHSFLLQFSLTTSRLKKYNYSKFLILNKSKNDH